jgi:hypothetical protein
VYSNFEVVLYKLCSFVCASKDGLLFSHNNKQFLLLDFCGIRRRKTESEISQTGVNQDGLCREHGGQLL